MKIKVDVDISQIIKKISCHVCSGDVSFYYSFSTDETKIRTCFCEKCKKEIENKAVEDFKSENGIVI
jgi:hypothetical protein